MQIPLPAGSGRVVSIHYKLTLDDGSLIDSTAESAFDYLHGCGNLVPGLEERIEGCKPGESFQVSVPCAKAYGVYDAKNVHHAKRADFPEEMELTPGLQFATETADGKVVPCWITAVEGNEVTVDFNHPLAGETLHFAIQVVGVRDATDEERKHGHPHQAQSGHECCGGSHECHE